MTSFSTHLKWLETLGVSEDDSVEKKQQHRFLIYMAILMSGGGILWGSLCLIFDFSSASIVPFGYVVLTFFNLLFLSLTQQFVVVRFIQVSSSILLPIIFQLMLGGFVRSGAVMLWSMLALGGSLTFSETRISLFWLVLCVVSTWFCGYYDETARLAYSEVFDPNYSTLFFVINISVIMSIFFILIVLLIGSHRQAQSDLKDSNQRVYELAENLEAQVQERTHALQKSLAQTQAIVSHLADGLIAVDHQGKITTLNPSLGLLFSLSKLYP